MITGLFLYAAGIHLTIKANIGYAPWDGFHVGLSNKIGLSIGAVLVIVGIVIVIIVTLLKEKFGLGTICNIILIGLFLDLLFFIDIIPKAENYLVGITLLITGLFIIAFGSYFYIKSGFGAGPRDNLMVVLARRTKLPAGLCRSIIELLVTVVGWILGGMVGLGTVISVIAVGFCIQIVFRLFKFDVTSVKHETLSETYVMLRRKDVKKVKFMTGKTIIRAADYLPEPDESADLESMRLPQSQAMLLNIFGDMPDYTNKKFEKLWQEIFNAEENDIIAYCLEKGVDVMGNDGEPVSGWRDIAVMLKAIDKGLLELA